MRACIRVRILNKLCPPGWGLCVAKLTGGVDLPDTTVLHTHGLHVSPYEDNIDTHVNPQHSLLYEYDIPADHLMGTHWYHAHKHGSTYLQVQGGMVGGLLVLPSDSYLASMDADLKALYTSTTHSHLMMMNLWMFGGDDTDPGPFSLDSYTTISDKYNAAQSVDPNVVFESGTTTATATLYVRLLPLCPPNAKAPC